MSLRDHNIIVDLKPVGGGWVYYHPYAGGTVRIPREGEAESGADLVERVKRFRLAEGIPAGRPDYDIAVYIREKSPANDINARRPERNPVPEPIKETLTEALRAWLDGVSPRKPALIYEADADERADICAACPLNIPFAGRTKAESEDIAYRSITLRGVVKYSKDPLLGACKAHKIELSSAVFLDIDFLPKRSLDAPLTCWIPQ